MTRAETLTPVLPQRFAPSELEAAARWVRNRVHHPDSTLAQLVATFQALDAILVRSSCVVALRDLLPRAGLEALYLPSPGAATGKLTSIPGAIRQGVLADIGCALRAEFIATGRDMVQVEADDGARLIVHAVEVRGLVMAAVNVQLIEAR